MNREEMLVNHNAVGKNATQISWIHNRISSMNKQATLEWWREWKSFVKGIKADYYSWACTHYVHIRV